MIPEEKKGTLDVTPWMEWVLGCLGRAIDGAQDAFIAALDEARLWERMREIQLNERQRKVIEWLVNGFGAS